MVIKLEKGNIVLQGDAVNVFIASGNVPANLTGVDANLVLSEEEIVDEGNHENQFLISFPGEYEVKDVFVYAVDTNNSGTVNLFSIDIDSVKLVFLGSKFEEIDKSTIEEIGMNHILIMTLEDDFEKKLKFVSDFDPNIIIPLTSNKELVEKLSKELGIAMPEAESKLKIKATDFEEEAPLELFLLK